MNENKKVNDMAENEGQKPDTAGRKPTNLKVDFSTLETTKDTLERFTFAYFAGEIPESKYTHLVSGVNSATRILSLHKNMELDARIKALEKEFSSD
jgi:hypothetical protein